MSGSSVSVVIPAYNAGRCIGRAIRSVLAQTVPPKDVIVVDDGSDDDTARVVRDLSREIIILRRPNGGPGAARNSGVASATGALVSFLDADDEYQPRMIATLSDALSEFPNAEVASGAFLKESALGTTRHPVANRVAGGAHSVVLRDFFTEARRNGSFVNSDSVMVRKRALDAVGGFREDIRFGEDVDLWCKLAGRYAWVFVDELVSIYHHDVSTSATLRTPDREWPTDMLMTESQMSQWVRPELWDSFRRYRRDWLLAQARGSIRQSATRRAHLLLERIAPAPISLGWALTRTLVNLPLPVGKSLLALNQVMRNATGRLRFPRSTAG